MKKNIGKTDKIIRMIIGIIIIISGTYFKSVWGVLGMIPVLTSQAGICPVYLPFGINTISGKKGVKIK